MSIDELPEWLSELITDNDGDTDAMDIAAAVEWLKEKVQEDIDSGEAEAKKRWGIKRTFTATVTIEVEVEVEAVSESAARDLIEQGVTVSFDESEVDEQYSTVTDISDLCEKD